MSLELVVTPSIRHRAAGQTGSGRHRSLGSPAALPILVHNSLLGKCNSSLKWITDPPDFTPHAALLTSTCDRVPFGYLQQAV
jgi:hypothetical protein